MTQFAKLSTETKNIVLNFLNSTREKRIFTESYKQLIVSLYAEMGNADKNILETLSEYQIPLEEYFSSDEICHMKEEYHAIIEFCHSLDEAQSIKYSEYTPLPESLVELCAAIAKPEKNKSILLPYTGSASFAPLCDGASVVDGFEISPKQWALSQIVLKAINSKSNIVLSEGLAFEETRAKYDYVFAFPPMGMVARDNRVIINTIYDIIVNHLNDDGEFYAVLPYSFCSDSSGWFDVRKILLDKRDYSAMVIALPAMLSPVTSVKLALVHFKKNGKRMAVLADVTSDAFFAHQDVAGRKKAVLKVNSVLETIQKQDEKYVWVGNADTSVVLNMQPSRYLISQNLPQLNNGEEYVELGDLIEIVPLTRDEERLNKIRLRNSITHSPYSNNVTDEEHESIISEYNDFEQNNILPLVGMKELSSNYLNCVVNKSNIPMGKKLEYTYLAQDCLLVGYMSGKFKVGRTEGFSSQSPVTLRSEIIPFHVTSDKVTEDYVLHCLAEEYVVKQALCLETGITITRLGAKDFKKICIKVPSIEEQNRLCKEDTRASLTESDRKIIESYEEFRKDMHMKKHAIGQTLFNLKNWWKVLQKARKEGAGVVSDSAMVGKTQPLSVAEIYDNLQEVITKLQQQINTLDRGNGLVTKNFALTEFIEDYISNPANKSPLFTFLYDETSHHASQTISEFDYNEETGIGFETGKIIINEGDPIEYAEFAPEGLKIIFDNIVSNAISHGFEGRENGANIIKFELKSEGDDYVITISNNGNPLNCQISSQDVFTYNKSSKNGKEHFGIGGYEVLKLMREFGGDALFISDPESDFPVTYKLVFHNTNIQTLEL